MKFTTLVLALAALPSFAAAPADAPADTCPLTSEQVAKATGQKVQKRELQTGLWGATQCVFTMESGTVQVSRVLPVLKKVKTEAELAEVFAREEARRKLKDFSVPAYSCSGGLYVVLPGGVWQVLAHRGPGAPLDPTRVAQALIALQAR